MKERETVDTVGKAIQWVRQIRNMTQEDLADAIGCTQTYVSFLENSKRTIDMNVLERIAKVLSVNVFLIVYIAEHSEFRKSNPQLADRMMAMTKSLVFQEEE